MKIKFKLKPKNIKFDKIWREAIADLLINLSAGWFGSILILPNSTRITSFQNVLVLTENFILGIFSLMMAVNLKKENSRRKI